MLIILILFKFINDLFIILKVKLYKTILFYKFRLIIFINIVSSFDDIDIIREKRRNNLFIYIKQRPFFNYKFKQYIILRFN